MKKTKILFLLLFCLIVLSCSGELKISLFTRDLGDVASSKETVLYTNVNVIVERLNDIRDIDFLKRTLNGFSNEQRVKYDYSDALSFDIKVPVIKKGTEIDSYKDLFFIVGINGKERTDYYLKYNKELLARIDTYFYNAYYQRLDLSKFKIKFEINNDERKEVSLITYSAYVNGKSYPFSHEEKLGERDRLTVEVSEIFSKYITENAEKDYPIFSINK